MLIHALPIFHVHGLFVASHGALGRRQDAVARPPTRAVSSRCSARDRLFMGVPSASYGSRLLAEAALTREACAAMRLVGGSAPLLIETFAAFRARAARPSSSATA